MRKESQTGDTAAAAKGKTKRRNHFVPGMLLENLTDEDGKLCFFDRRTEAGRILKTTPDSLYRERDLYVVRGEGGGRDDSAEDRFAGFERKAAMVLKRIITALRDVKDPALSSSERETLDRYVYFQRARGGYVRLCYGSYPKENVP